MKQAILSILPVTLILLSALFLCACDPPSELTHDIAITDSFRAIKVDTVADADVTILPAADGVSRVTGALRNNRSLTAEAVDGVLTIRVEDNRPFFMRWISHRSAITLYLPEDVYGALTINGRTGNVTLTGLAFEEAAIDISTGDVKLSEFFTRKGLSIATSTGDVALTGVTAIGDLVITQSTGAATLSNVQTNSLSATGSTGDLTLADVVALKGLTLKRSTGDTVGERLIGASLLAEANSGDMRFNEVTVTERYSVTTTSGRNEHKSIAADTIVVEADTGKMSLGDVLATDWIAAGTKTGDITITKTAAGGLFKLRASTGDITLDRADAGEFDIETSTGSVKGTILTEKIFTAKSSSGRITVPETTTGGKCRVVTSTGRIDLAIAE